MERKEKKEEVKENVPPPQKSEVRDTAAGYYILELKRKIKIFQGGKGTP